MFSAFYRSVYNCARLHTYHAENFRRVRYTSNALSTYKRTTILMRYLLLLLVLTMSNLLMAETARYRIVWQENPDSEALIVWDQQSGSDPVVHYGKLDHGVDHTAYANSAQSTRSEVFRGMTNTSVKLTGLEADTHYYFVIKDSDSVSERFFFQTAANTKKPFKFIQGGDSRSGTATRQRGNRMVAKLRPLFVSFGGDLIASGSDEQWQAWLDHWQLTIAADGRITPISPVRGNHESSSEIPGIFHIDNQSAYYKVVISDGLFCQYELNSNISATGDQKTWLENDLAAHAADYTFLSASYHKPMRPHQLIKSEGNAIYNAWAELFWQYRFSLLAENDSHCVKRTKRVRPDNGPGSDEGFIEDPEGYVFIGEGTWGAPKYSGGGTNDNKTWTLDAGKFNAFDLVHVYQDHMEVRTVKFDNVDNVGSLTELDELVDLPENIDIWQAKGGAVQYIGAAGVGIQATPVGPVFLASSVELNASAPTDGSITKVDFFIDDQLVGTDTNGVGGWTVDWPANELGSYNFHIVATHADDSETRGEAVSFYVYLPGAAQLAFDYGSEWKYYDAVAAPAAEWASPEFDDDSWASSNAEFGLSNSTTVLQDHDVACYFRKTFDLVSLDNLSLTDFNFAYDDGAILYVNGVEVKRFNMPDAVEAEVLHTTFADSTLNTSTTFQIQPKHLKVGRNLIAVSIHNRSASSSDILFDGKISSNQYNVGELAILDPDGDGDGLPDRLDQFPNDPERMYPLNADPTLLVQYSFDNLNGGIAVDSSDNALDATLVNLDPVLASTDNAADFSSADGYIQTPVIPGEFKTIFFRFKSNRNLVGDDAAEVLINFGLNTSNQYIWQGASTGGLTNETITLGNDGTTALTMPIDNLWHHYAFVWDGSNYKVYVDGVERSTSYGGGDDSAKLISSIALELGARTNKGNFSDDIIDELRIYSRPLSKTDINEIIATTDGKTTYTVNFNAGTEGTITAGDPVQQLTIGEDAVAPSVTSTGEGDFAGWDTPFTKVSADIDVNAIYSFEAQLYVDSSISASGDGSSWNQAFQTLDEALAIARTGNTIHMASGTYTAGATGIDITAAINLYAGYPQGGGLRNSRSNPTILTGDLNENGSSYATSLLNISAPVTIDGLSFTKSVKTSSDSNTAAIVFLSGSQGSLVKNCIISENAHKYSSVIALLTGAENKDNPVVFENCLIRDNGDSAGLGSHPSHGGILMYAAGGIHFNNCTFRNNTADSGDLFHGGTNGSLKLILNSCSWINSSSSNALLSRNNGGGSATVIILNSVIDADGILASKSMSNDSVVFNSLFSGPATGSGFTFNKTLTSTDAQLTTLANNGGWIDTILPSLSSPLVDGAITILQDGPNGPLYYESIYGDSASSSQLTDDLSYTPIATSITFTPATDANRINRNQGVNTFAIGATEEGGQTGSPSYSLTFLANTGGTLIGLTNQTIASDSSATSVTANAANGYQFINWTNGVGAEISTQPQLTINNPQRSDSYTANFGFTSGSDPSLLLHYTFDDISSGNVTDQSANNNNGSLVNLNPALTSIDQAIDFSSASGHVSTPLINDKFQTIAFRFKSNRALVGDDSNGEPIMNFGLASRAGYIWSGGSTGGINNETITIGSNGGTGIAVPIDTAWHHYAFVWETDRYAIYLDGVRQTALHKDDDTPANLITNQGVELGARTDTNSYCNDSIDDLMIYNRSLSPAEIATMSAQLSLDKDSDGIADSWEMNHFGDLDRGATSDDDGDGMTLAEEYLSDTDPSDKTSKFELNNISSPSNNQLDLIINRTSSQRVYTLLFSSDLGLSDPWTEVPGFTNMPGTDAQMQLSITQSLQGFYRLRVELP